jgi:hypothetical protein
MTEHFVIRVNIGDLIGRKITELQPFNYSIRFEQLFLRLLEEETGGLLCISHFHIPEIQLPLENCFFPMEIHCCCRLQVIMVENRLAELFK